MVNTLISQKVDDFSDVGEVAKGGAQQFLMFMLSGEVYGINILEVKEIIDYGRVTRVPMMSECIAGVVNLRGSVVPIIDLALRFSMMTQYKTKRSSIVILEVEYGDHTLDIGITVDAVNKVLDISEDDIIAAPSFGTKIRTDFIEGMGKVEGQLLVLLNVSSVLSIDELSVIEGVS